VDVPSQEVLYGNRETFLGYTLNQLRDRATILQSVHPEDQAAVDTHWQQVLTACTDALPMVDYRFRTADGAWEWLQQRTAIIARSQENQPAQLLITIGVITAQKRAEEERVALERTLQETQKLESLGVLAGGIAHDFNNLLVAVLGNAEIALMDLDRDHPAYTSVEHIQLAGQRAAELTGQMLAYAGKGRFVVAPLSLNTLVQELKPLLRTSTSKLVDLTYDLAPNLPFIDGDATQIRQILMNLVINGAEAMEGRAGRVTVTTGLRRVDLVEVGNFHLAVDLAPGTYVALSVADTGCGIDVATQSRIFDPFFTTKFTGRGLGLATVLGIVRAHGGAIQIDSVVGHGTQMTVLLPQGATQGENPKDDSGTQVAEQSRPQHQTVLVIDDEADVRTVTARVLERLGYKVLLASDGVMGAELFAQHSNQVSAVLLDLTMPKLSAEETVTRLHATSTTVPIVVISGYSAQDVVNRFAPGVIAGVLQKPFKPQQLAQTLKQVVVAPRTDRG
jgi:PAS domain S-box-containing protein